MDSETSKLRGQLSRCVQYVRALAEDNIRLTDLLDYYANERVRLEEAYSRAVKDSVADPGGCPHCHLLNQKLAKVQEDLLFFQSACAYADKKILEYRLETVFGGERGQPHQDDFEEALDKISGLVGVAFQKRDQSWHNQKILK